MKKKITHVMMLKEKYNQHPYAERPKKSLKALRWTCEALLKDFYHIKNELSISGYKRPMSIEESDFYSYMHRKLDFVIETLVEAAK